MFPAPIITACRPQFQYNEDVYKRQLLLLFGVNRPLGQLLGTMGIRFVMTLSLIHI